MILPIQSSYDGYDLEPAYKLAREQLAKIEDIEQLCLKSGSRYLTTGSQQEIAIEYINRLYRITMPNIEILLTDSEDEVSIRDRVLILHYLLSAKGTPIANKLISFKELPGGSNYFRTFSKRAIEPIVEHFGEQPHGLIDITVKLGGHTVALGDVAVTVNAFSRVPVTIVLWQGDEEFPDQGDILFDATISDYLSTYDVTVLCESIIWKLVKFSKVGRASTQ
jgi:hypothetical protein